MNFGWNWQIRHTVFHSLVQKGVSHELAYDAAMCAMTRAGGGELKWDAPTPEQLERLLKSQLPSNGDEQE